MADTQEDELIFEIAYSASGTTRDREGALRSIEGIRRKPLSGGLTLFQYHNPDTGASCDFLLEHNGELRCEMPLPRPTCYALECLPLMVRVARELRAQIEVVSPPDEPAQPFSPSVEELMVRWQRANLEEREYQTERGRKFFVLPATQLEAVWEYSLLRRDMGRRYGRTRVQVPPVSFWGRKSDSRGLRVALWPRLGPVAFPEVDYIRLEEPPAPLRNGAIYSAPELLAAVGPLLKSLAMPIHHYYFDKENQLKNLIEIVSSLPTVSPSGFVQLELGDILDEDPPAWD